MRDESYRGVRVAVLGAAGFVGRWVSCALWARGASPWLVVRDRPSAEAIFDRYGVRGEIITLDLQSSGTVRAFFEDIRPSIVFNLAGYGVDRSERDEQTSFDINANLVETVCDAAARVRDPRWPGQAVVHAGSAAELGPPTAYGRSKLAGTHILHRSCETLGIKGVAARLFTVYGPGEHQGRLLPSLLNAAVTGQPVALSAGEQRRDFTYVGDVAEGLVRLGMARAGVDGPIDLATGQLVTVRRFVETAASVLSIPPERLGFGMLPTRPDETTHGAVPLERLQESIGWVPQTTIAEGIRRTWAFERR